MAHFKHRSGAVLALGTASEDEPATEIRLALNSDGEWCVAREGGPSFQEDAERRAEFEKPVGDGEPS